MAGATSPERLRTPRARWGRALLLLVLAISGRVHAQEDSVYHSRQTTFRIPFQVDGDRRVQQVILHVSEDMGRSFKQVGTALPGDKGFTFTARRDGWYYFQVQTQDVERRLYPPTIDGTQPGLRVFVDTLPPDVKVHAQTGLPRGQVGVDWDIRDEALDVSSLRLEYRVPGQFWQERQIQRNAIGQVRWDVTGSEALEVRLQAKDKAGNLGEGSARVRPEGQPMDRVDDPPGGGGNVNVNEPAQIRKINSTKISLNYKLEDVGPSDVSSVEIWKTRDGRMWQRHPKDAGKTPPFVIEVEGEGRYGLSLIAKSGVGLGDPPPRPGDTPHLWVEVDLTKPDVRLLDVVVGRGADTGNLTVTWTASDKNMGRRPITLAYATRAEGPWTAIPGAREIDNSGKYVWRMQPDVPFEFFVRVEAQDEAGNLGQDDTRQSIKVDLSTPKARVIGIEPIKN